MTILVSHEVGSETKLTFPDKENDKSSAEIMRILKELLYMTSLVGSLSNHSGVSYKVLKITPTEPSIRRCQKVALTFFF
jgi:hypothetical protein